MVQCSRVIVKQKSCIFTSDATRKARDAIRRAGTKKSQI